MAIHNSQVAEIFNDVADLLEIEGANEFRIRAYRNAARSIGNMPAPVADLLEQGRDMSELPAIGKDLAGKIQEIVQTGHLGALEDLQKHFPPSILELTRVPGLGPKRIRILDRIGINSREKLRMAAETGRLHRISGFGEKTEERLLEALRQSPPSPSRLKLLAAEQIANSVAEWLKRGSDYVVPGGIVLGFEAVPRNDLPATATRHPYNLGGKSRAIIVTGVSALLTT